MMSKKYVMGESYGGYRGPRITHYLQTQLGVGVNGLFLVSPYLNPNFGDGNLSPIPWMITLPSITASHLERQNKLTPEAMHDVIAYDEGDYATALIKGPQDPALTNAMISKVKCVIYNVSTVSLVFHFLSLSLSLSLSLINKLFLITPTST